MLDWEGNMQQPQLCQREIPLDDIPDDNMISTVKVSAVKRQAADIIVESHEEHCLPHPCLGRVIVEVHVISGIHSCCISVVSIHKIREVL